MKTPTPNLIESAKEVIFQECEDTLKRNKKSGVNDLQAPIFDKAKVRINTVLKSPVIKKFLEKTLKNEKRNSFYIDLLRIIGRPEELWDKKVYETKTERAKKYKSVYKAINKLIKVLGELNTEEFLDITQSLNQPKTHDSITMAEIISYLRSTDQMQKINKIYSNRNESTDLVSETGIKFLKEDRNKIYGLGIFDSIYPIALEVTKKGKKNEHLSFRNYLIRELYIHFNKYLKRPHHGITSEIISILFHGEFELDSSKISVITKHVRKK